jgi:hypothetical protein
MPLPSAYMYDRRGLFALPSCGKVGDVLKRHSRASNR